MSDTWFSVSPALSSGSLDWPHTSTPSPKQQQRRPLCLDVCFLTDGTIPVPLRVAATTLVTDISDRCTRGSMDPVLLSGHRQTRTSPNPQLVRAPATQMEVNTNIKSMQFCEGGAGVPGTLLPTDLSSMSPPPLLARGGIGTEAKCLRTVQVVTPEPAQTHL